MCSLLTYHLYHLSDTDCIDMMRMRVRYFSSIPKLDFKFLKSNLKSVSENIANRKARGDVWKVAETHGTSTRFFFFASKTNFLVRGFVHHTYNKTRFCVFFPRQKNFLVRGFVHQRKLSCERIRSSYI